MAPGELMVVKCGGNALVAREQVCADVAALVRQGRRVVLVHGGSAEIKRLGARLGIPQERLVSPSGVSSRLTTAATIEILLLALLGKVKPELVTWLLAQRVRAVGLSGVDGGLLRARRKPARRAVVDGRTVVVRGDHSGRIVGVAADLLSGLLDAGYTPVVSPPAIAEDGGIVNVDADRAAAAVAAALGARQLVLLTGAAGVLRDEHDDSTLIRELRLSPTSPTAVRAAGGMGLKLIAAWEALLGGVPDVRVADGRRSRPILRALAGAGTRVLLAQTEPREEVVLG